MKTIYLIRHAKSDWNNHQLSDFERPLNKRGKKNAPLMGRIINEIGCYPDFIISSPALRAIKTIEAIASKINYPFEKVQFESTIYHASLEQLKKIIDGLDHQHNEIAIVGHNPGLTYLSNYLTNDYIDNIVTCGIVKIELSINHWNEIIEGIGSKKFYIYPKMYS